MDKPTDAQFHEMERFACDVAGAILVKCRQWPNPGYSCQMIAMLAATKVIASMWPLERADEATQWAKDAFAVGVKRAVDDERLSQGKPEGAGMSTTPDDTMYVTRTARGFEKIECAAFPPELGTVPLVWASSSIGDYADSFDRPGSSFLWVGEKHRLNREQVLDLAAHLTAWCMTGSLESAVDETGAN